MLSLRKRLIYNATKKNDRRMDLDGKNKQLQNLFQSFQNNPKSVFYTTTKLTKALIKKNKNSCLC